MSPPTSPDVEYIFTNPWTATVIPKPEPVLIAPSSQIAQVHQGKYLFNKIASNCRHTLIYSTDLGRRPSEDIDFLSITPSELNSGMRKLGQLLDLAQRFFGRYRSPKAPREITGVQVRSIGTIDNSLDASTRYAIVDRPGATITIGDRVEITSETKGLTRAISLRITGIRKLHTNHVVFRASNGLDGRDRAYWDLYVPYEAGFVSRTVRIIRKIFYPLLTPSPRIPPPLLSQNMLTDDDINVQIGIHTISDTTLTPTLD